MRYFFVDYENVDTEGLNGLTKLTSRDTVFIFYSERHSRMTFGLHRRIMEAMERNVHFEYRKVKRPDPSEKQVVDQALMEEVDLILNNSKSNLKNDYYIISKDSDYDPFVNDWNRQGFNINRFLTISKGNIEKKEKLEHIIRARLVDDRKGKSFNLTQDDISKIADFIMSSNNKSQLNRYLQTMFYNQDVKYIFTRLKDITFDM